MAIAIPLAPVGPRTTSAPRPVRSAVRTTPRAHSARPMRSSKPQQVSHLTRRGRLVVLFGGVIALFSAMLMFGSFANATLTNQGPATQVVVVQPGESLWSIAQAVAPSADPRETVGRIRDLNGMTSAVVVKGQSLIVPVSN